MNTRTGMMPHFKYIKGQWYKFRNRQDCNDWVAKFGDRCKDLTRNPRPAPWSQENPRRWSGAEQ